MRVTGLVKHNGWRFITYDFVGAEQVLKALNEYDQDFLREYHYRDFKCYKSAQRITDAELCVLLSKWRMAYPEISAQKFIFYPRPWKNLGNDLV